MKTIYSDKIGRNIHSPFVYKLVAHVLCNPHSFYAFKKIEELGLGKRETNRLKTLFRLVNYFWFEEVYFIGCKADTYSTVCSLVRPDIKIKHIEKYEPAEGSVSNEAYQRLVIFGSAPEAMAESITVSEVWVVDDLKGKSLRNFFSGLKFVDNARITMEFNRIGIVIFNRIFEKQDYVIKP